MTVCQVETLPGESYSDDEERDFPPDNDPFFDEPPVSINQVSSRKSPHLSCFYQHCPALICIDTGAESNLISEKFAKYVGIPIKPTSHRAVQADGKMLENVRESHNVQLTRNAYVFNFDALIIRDLGSDIIVGEPFLEENDIGVHSARKKIIIKGKDVISYAQPQVSDSTPSMHRVSTFLCHAPTKSTTVLPDDYITIDSPGSFQDYETVVLEPRVDSQSTFAEHWPLVQLTSVTGGQIQIKNKSSDPVLLKRNDPFCQIRATKDISVLSQSSSISSNAPSNTKIHQLGSSSEDITIDPNNQLSSSWCDKFHKLHLDFDLMFEPAIDCYNDSSGRIRARVNIGTVHPPPKNYMSLTKVCSLLEWCFIISIDTCWDWFQHT